MGGVPSLYHVDEQFWEQWQPFFDFRNDKVEEEEEFNKIYRVLLKATGQPTYDPILYNQDVKRYFKVNEMDSQTVREDGSWVLQNPMKILPIGEKNPQLKGSRWSYPMDNFINLIFSDSVSGPPEVFL